MQNDLIEGQTQNDLHMECQIIEDPLHMDVSVLSDVLIKDLEKVSEAQAEEEMTATNLPKPPKPSTGKEKVRICLFCEELDTHRVIKCPKLAVHQREKGRTPPTKLNLAGPKVCLYCMSRSHTIPRCPEFIAYKRSMGAVSKKLHLKPISSKSTGSKVKAHTTKAGKEWESAKDVKTASPSMDLVKRVSALEKAMANMTKAMGFIQEFKI